METITIALLIRKWVLHTHFGRMFSEGMVVVGAPPTPLLQRPQALS